MSTNRRSPNNIFGIDFDFHPPAENKSQQGTSKSMLAIQSVLAAMAIPAGIFYRKYAHECVEIDFCAKPVSFLPNKELQAVALEVSGGGGFSGTATLFGMRAAPGLRDTYTGLGSKSAKGFLIVYCAGFAIIRCGQVILGTLGSMKPGDKYTDQDVLLALTLPTLAIVPAALYNASLTFPHLLSKLIYTANKICAGSEEDQAIRQNQGILVVNILISQTE